MTTECSSGFKYCLEITYAACGQRLECSDIIIPNMDLFEVGLNADAFTCEDVRWLGEHGIHVFSNLGDYPDWWEKMVTRGVLGFKTNYAAAYTNWWNSRH